MVLAVGFPTRKDKRFLPITKIFICQLNSFFVPLQFRYIVCR